MALGKETGRFMDEAVYAHLGFRSRRTIVKPGKGLDNGVLSMGHGRVMIITADPVSVIPSMGTRRSAWLSVHLVASDYTASGVDPEFAVFAYNFPSDMPAKDREEYVRCVGDECRELGIAIAAGHTGSYPGGGYTVIGTGVMFGTAPNHEYITPAMARSGDSILMTKHAAIEATASLALSFPSFAADRIGAELARQAREQVALCSTVRDARTARRIGIGEDAVTSMHDATEGGVLGGLEEMAYASRRCFTVDVERIPVAAETKAICAEFGIDPLRTMGEGSLLMTCRPDRVAELARVLSRRGVPNAEIGRVGRGEGLLLRTAGGKVERFEQGLDRYWGAYAAAVSRGTG